MRWRGEVSGDGVREEEKERRGRVGREVVGEGGEVPGRDEVHGGRERCEKEMR